MLNPQPRQALPDPLRRYSPWLYKGFARYVEWIAGRHFHSILVSSDGLPRVPSGRPIIVYSNHPSWWDPVMFVLIGEALFPGHRGFGPIEAQSLKRYAILERVGAFGIELDSARGGVMFMILGRRILSNDTSILWLTAEGAFTDVRRRPVSIRAGLGYLARLVPGLVVLPMAIEYPFWNESRPEALCCFGEMIDMDRFENSQRNPAELHTLFESSLTRTMDRLSLDSLHRSPARFRSLLRGSAGVGGVYDAWRRVRSWSRGSRFDSSHEQQK